MKKDPEVFLGHVLESIQRVELYLKKVTQKQFLKNFSLQDAIVRRLQIIGEAVKKLPPSLREKYPDIPWKAMTGTRDILIHQYDGIDLELVWKIAKDKLPPLKKHVAAILAAEMKLSVK